ncbi:MAG: 2-C-methyl-D-erythritol 2,4-cyclodiphosphate synthase [Firmicutes bacterium]|nr:2-C-methyl-D-erythritol 2,4-cyclodiphosphate synthase [Bacillota bacterium]
MIAIIPAAGSGRRMKAQGEERPKLLIPLAGEEIFLRTLKTLNLPAIEAFFIAVSVTEQETYARLLKREFLEKKVYFCPGGKERQDSIYSALLAVREWTGWRVPEERRLLLIHDAARPLLERDVLERVVAAARQTGAAVAGVPVKDTIKEVGAEGFILSTPERSKLRAVQTPQVFTWPVLWAAYTQARTERLTGATDDAFLVEKTGHPVQLVPGSERNIKITTPADLRVAEAFLGGLPSPASDGLRVGYGFDVHRLVPGRRLVLGGVEIPSEVGLEGHSDADVLIHALMDALLGAVGQGDIGEHFPDNDPAYHNIDSGRLLEDVMTALAQSGARPVNVDVTVIAQYPKLAPYRHLIRENLATRLGLSVTEVNIKATTTERLGFIGRQEGIAAQVVALVKHCSACSLV